MAIKLIQIDCEDPTKIALSLGEHLFGRGKLLGCDDKRISRNHGELHVFEGHIEMKALHQNPCFYTKKGSEEKEILRKDSVINLSNGDRFGLLPDAFWYEVVKCSNGSQEIEKENADTEDYIEKTLNPDETINDNESPSIISNASDTVLHPPDSQVQSSNLSNNETNKVPVKRTHCDKSEGSNKKLKAESEDDKSDLEIAPTGVQNAPTEVALDPTEVKTEPIEVKSEPTEMKTEATQDTSSENNDTEAVKQESNDAGPSINQASNDGVVNGNTRPPRERCMYGANCYRRNPSHFAEFCHPADSDWGAGPQAPCPFGAACSRRDPRHYRDHTHPPGHRPPPPPGKIRKRRGSSYSPPPGLLMRITPKRRRRNPSSCSGTPYSDTSDDTEASNEDDDEAEASKRAWRGSSYSPPPGMLVRLRKKHLRRLETYQDFPDDDSDESDPFDTDGSDEWKPEFVKK